MDEYFYPNKYQKRAEIYSERAFELLKRIDLNEEFSREMEDCHSALNDSELNSEQTYNVLIDQESSLADEFILLQNEIYGATIASFHHLWERDVKELCSCRLLRNYKVSSKKQIITEENVAKFSFNNVKDFLVVFEVPEKAFDEMYILSLVANVIKHGRGDSSKSLRKFAPEMYAKLVYMCDLYEPDWSEEGIEINSNMGMLKIEDIKRFADATVAFWKNLSECKNFRKYTL